MQEGIDGKKRFRRRVITYGVYAGLLFGGIALTNAEDDGLKNTGAFFVIAASTGLFFQLPAHFVNNMRSRGNQIYFSTIFNTQNSTYETLGTNTKQYNGKIGQLSRSIKKQIRKDLKRIKAEDK